MNTLEISEERIMTVWGWCSEVYLQHGFRLAFPAKTDPTKTYQWRYARSIASKFDEWEFDEGTAKKFISIAVLHCKQAGVIRKGLAALHQSNLLQICYDKLQEQADVNKQCVGSIEHIHAWLMDRSGDDLLETLLYRRDPDEFCNLVKWVQASRISRLYLALSKTCGKALARLAKSHPEEREILPKTTMLYMLRVEFTEDASNITQTKRILGSDWRELCL
jgi:hypothetical protein